MTLFIFQELWILKSQDTLRAVHYASHRIIPFCVDPSRIASHPTISNTAFGSVSSCVALRFALYCALHCILLRIPFRRALRIALCISLRLEFLRFALLRSSNLFCFALYCFFVFRSALYYISNRSELCSALRSVCVAFRSFAHYIALYRIALLSVLHTARFRVALRFALYCNSHRIPFRGALRFAFHCTLCNRCGIARNRYGIASQAH
jgi:hypothetical protein